MRNARFSPSNIRVQRLIEIMCDRLRARAPIFTKRFFKTNAIFFLVHRDNKSSTSKTGESEYAAYVHNVSLALLWLEFA